MREAQELLGETQLLHQFKRGGVNGVAAKIAQKISMFLDNRYVYTAAGKQKAKHQAGRPATGHDNGRADVLNGPAVILRHDFRFFHHRPPVR
ncbi:hypothetical protein D3C87_1390910 [compost metagenome]